jgi:DNA-directed RNA polymerase I, II, and III subunit RPABC2
MLTQSSGGAIDFDEEAEPEIMDDGDDAEGGEDPEVDDNIVVSGDASAAQAAKDKAKNSVDAEKAKKVPNESRTTTPYMTKYEKARVLGTRALQIR